MKEQKNGKCTMQSSGVTLVALILTIIILLILVATSVALVIRWNIIEKSEYATDKYQIAAEKESIDLAYENYTMLDEKDDEGNPMVDGATVNKKDENGEAKGWTVTFPNGHVYDLDEDGNITGPKTSDGTGGGTGGDAGGNSAGGNGGNGGGLLGDEPSNGPQITVEGGEKVTLTEDNVAKYLGMVVKDFKTSEGGTETVTVGTDKTGGTQENVIVSTTYRLYWVDFDNKYGEGNGTIYLKADCTNKNYPLYLDTTEDTETNVKIKNLNPELYKTGNTPPTSTNNNMKAVTWLLHTDNWDKLKEGISDTYKNDVKYIVGAPPLEMMMDSYNTHYDLLGEQTPYTGTIETGQRKRLFYQYPYNGDANKYGYGVGPYSNGSAGGSSGTNGYYYRTSDNTVTSDPTIDSMYYPGTSIYYWLASPLARNNNPETSVTSSGAGYVTSDLYYNSQAYCPLVCLDSSVQLNLE